MAKEILSNNLTRDNLEFAPLSTRSYFINLTGQTFGKLTVLGYKGPKGKHTFWYCECECGAITYPTSNQLRRGTARSCGGPHHFLGVNAARFKHGMVDTPEYYTWRNMLNRCYWSKSKKFKYYGGRGIIVCDRWRTSFKNFYADMGPKPEGLTIERVDNSGNYCPENCRWATLSEQAMNRRVKKNAVRINYKGQIETFAGWSQITGIPDGTLRRRYHEGWSIEDILMVKPSRVNHIKALRQRMTLWRLK